MNTFDLVIVLVLIYPFIEGWVTGDKREPVLDAGDAFEVDRARAPHHADDLVPLLEQQFGQVGAVLARDPGDERAFGHHHLVLPPCPAVC